MMKDKNMHTYKKSFILYYEAFYYISLLFLGGGNMCLDDLSSCELIGLASSLAILIGENLNASESATLAAFLTALADNLAIIATVKAKEETDNQDLDFNKC